MHRNATELKQFKNITKQCVAAYIEYIIARGTEH